MIVTSFIILTLTFCLHFIYTHHSRAKEIIQHLKRGGFIKVSGLTIPRYLSLVERDFDLESLPTTLFLTLLLHEDTAFLRHKGFNLREILRAIKSTLFYGRLRGGSSISQQTAKYLFTDGSTHFFRKGSNRLKRKIIEIISTFALEQSLTKEEILYLYLSLCCKLPYPIFSLKHVVNYLGETDLADIKLHQFEPIFCILPSTTNIIRRIRAQGIGAFNFKVSYEIILILKRAIFLKQLAPNAKGFSLHLQNLNKLLHPSNKQIFTVLDNQEDEKVMIAETALELERIESTLTTLTFKREIIPSAKFYFANWQLAFLHLLRPRAETQEYSSKITPTEEQHIADLTQKHANARSQAKDSNEPITFNKDFPILKTSSPFDLIRILELSNAISTEELEKACHDNTETRDNAIILAKMLNSFLFEEPPYTGKDLGDKGRALKLEWGFIPQEFGDLIQSLFSLS